MDDETDIPQGFDLEGDIIEPDEHELEPGDCEKCGWDHPKCVAHNRQGLPCRGQVIRGARVCGTHGGRAPQVRAKAAYNIQTQEIERALVANGICAEEDLPHVDPRRQIQVAAAKRLVSVRWVEGMVASLQTHQLTQEVDKQGEILGVWLSYLEAQRKGLEVVLFKMEQLGIAEAAARADASVGMMMVAMLQSLLPQLGVDLGNPQVADTIRLALERVVEEG